MSIRKALFLVAIAAVALIGSFSVQAGACTESTDLHPMTPAIYILIAVPGMSMAPRPQHSSVTEIFKL